jgi:hypothetical protein
VEPDVTSSASSPSPAGELRDVLRPRLTDPRLDAVLEEQGYVVVPGAGKGRLRAMRTAHRRTMGRVPEGFDSTIYSGDEARKRAVHQALLEAMAPVLDALLSGYAPLLTSFVTKGRSEGGTMPPHQDWTFVDEQTSASLNVWIPLVDVDHRNGAMSVLPGGHRMPATIRGTDTPNAFRAVEDEVTGRMVELPMRAGDVLVHDHRLLHASPPNRRRRPRVVAGCAVIPETAAPIHFRQVGPHRVERYELDPSFYVEHTFGAEGLPASARRVATIDFEQPVFSIRDLPPAPAR